MQVLLEEKVYETRRRVTLTAPPCTNRNSKILKSGGDKKHVMNEIIHVVEQTHANQPIFFLGV